MGEPPPLHARKRDLNTPSNPASLDATSQQSARQWRDLLTVFVQASAPHAPHFYNWDNIWASYHRGLVLREEPLPRETERRRRKDISVDAWSILS